ncbi:flippase [Sutcliffiella horikoshii]|uniref:Flippase n=1 Tax=Sutcliffiella horikoshii TaxID=79883 RepID=A0A5D4T5M1_9BACI|nr:flippase [Sutcliffiella horikoshii]TYS69998.1 flippase [Sutcliffiella horikoshii]
MSELRELGNKSIIIFAGRVLGQVVTFISVIVIARLLGANVYGQFVYLISFLAIFTIISKLGIQNGIVSFLSRNSFNLRQKQSILNFSLRTAALLSIIVVILIYANKDFILEELLNNIEYENLFLLLIPIVIFDTLISILRSSLVAYRKIKEITLVDNLFNPISKTFLVILLVMVFKIENYYALVIPLYLSSIIGIIYYIIKIKELALFGKLEKDFNHIQIVKFSLPLLFTGVVIIITQNVDKYMIGYMIDAKNVGVYRMAIQFGTVSSIALLSVNTIFSPIISGLYFDNRISELKKMYQITTKWITIINLMIFGMILIFSKDIMRIGGEEFTEGAMALIIISIGQVVNSIVGSVGIINTMTGSPKLELYSGSVAMVLNVILNLFLIPIYGINGAAFATAIALLTNSMLNFSFMYSKLKMHPFDKSYLNLLCVFVVSVTSIYFLSDIIQVHYLVKILGIGFIYSIIFSLLIYRFVMSDNELRILKSEVNKRINRN